ncbi:MAG: hypothetical protein FWD29_08495, partial [Micrococcales bacterium]|nr:hypothetical protein [Micrococcales bacterium]
MTDLGVPMPLDPYRPYLNGPAVDVKEFVQKQIDDNDKREAVVAECMKRAGFEYHPIPFGGSRNGRDLTGDGGLLGSSWFSPSRTPISWLDDDRAVVANWGYGLSDRLPEDPTEEEHERLDFDPMFYVVTKQNDDYRRSLSAHGQAEYDMALLGHLGDDEAKLADLGGCLAEGEAAQPSTSGLPNQDFLNQYADMLDKVVQITIWDVPSHPEMVRAHDDWNQCLIGMGVD